MVLVLHRNLQRQQRLRIPSTLAHRHTIAHIKIVHQARTYLSLAWQTILQIVYEYQNTPVCQNTCTPVYVQNHTLHWQCILINFGPSCAQMFTLWWNSKGFPVLIDLPGSHRMLSWLPVALCEETVPRLQGNKEVASFTGQTCRKLWHTNWASQLPGTVLTPTLWAKFPPGKLWTVPIRLTETPVQPNHTHVRENNTPVFKPLTAENHQVVWRVGEMYVLTPFD